MPHPAYSWTHQKTRARLLAELRVVGAALCPICAEVMTPDMQLHLHHSNPEAKRMGLPGDTLAHAKCNLRHGDGSRNQPQRVRLSRQW